MASEPPVEEEAVDKKFDRPRHIAYFALCLRSLHQNYEKLDTNRLALVHFCVHALDLLGVWDDPGAVLVLRLNKSLIIEWIYSLQVTTGTGTTATGTTRDPTNNTSFLFSELSQSLPSDNAETETAIDRVRSFSGFKGGTFLGTPPAELYNHGHIAMTYTALATLRALGDPLDRVDKSAIVTAMKKSLQLPNGSFQCVAVGSERDMRFLYCACSISHMLGDWSGVDIDRAVSYVKACRAWDGGFALLPGQEGHGGSTFCAVASLVLMNRTDVLDASDASHTSPTNSSPSNCSWRKDLIHWCVNRQEIRGGLQGRPNKDEDTCYSYWVGGTLRLLGHDSLLDQVKLCSFVMQCQTKMGGFSKFIGAPPDVLHSFYSMAYLSLSQTHFEYSDGDGDGDPHGVLLKDLNCTLGIRNVQAATFGPLFP